jgi:hypothetical protein
MAEVPTWFTGFVADVIAQLPRDIDEATAMRWMQDPQGLEQALRGALTGSAGVAGAGASVGPKVAGALKNDKASEGWQLLEDVTEPATVSFESIEARQILEDGMDLLGDEMVDYVEKMDVPKLGQRHAEYLVEHQDLIPEELRRNSLVFLGTVWLGSEGNHHVPCLSFYQGEWELTFGILEGGVESRDLMVQPKE